MFPLIVQIIIIAQMLSTGGESYQAMPSVLDTDSMTILGAYNLYMILLLAAGNPSTNTDSL